MSASKKRVLPYRIAKWERLAFIDGILYSAWFMVVYHKEDSLAQDIMSESGYTKKDFLLAQRRSGIDSRRMNKVIRESSCRDD